MNGLHGAPQFGIQWSRSEPARPKPVLIRTHHLLIHLDQITSRFPMHTRLEQLRKQKQNYIISAKPSSSPSYSSSKRISLITRRRLEGLARDAPGGSDGTFRGAETKEP
jgi:hypothetical protein